MTIHMNLGRDSYDIIVERGLLAKADRHLNLDRRVLVVTDSGVPEVYARTVAAGCREGIVCTVEMGEASKSLEGLEVLLGTMLEHGFSHIILVNDGSKPENLHYFTDLAEAHPEITLLHHEVNKGKGAALKNAFRWFLENRPEGYGVVTVDGDNQHHPADTRACVEHMMATGHCVLGCRDFDQEDVPTRSRFGNKTTSMVFKIFVGMTISDTQTGLRALTREALETLVNVYGDRFEYETNMLLAFKDNAIVFDEVKIRTVYIEENKSSHFRTFTDSWRIYKLILAHFFGTR